MCCRDIPKRCFLDLADFFAAPMFATLKHKTNYNFNTNYKFNLLLGNFKIDVENILYENKSDNGGDAHVSNVGTYH